MLGISKVFRCGNLGVMNFQGIRFHFLKYLKWSGDSRKYNYDA